MFNMPLLIICISTSPIFISVGLTLAALILCYILLGTFSDLWPVSILAVAFIGGVIVLYVYVSSVAQNEVTTFNPLILLFVPVVILPIVEQLITYVSFKCGASTITDLFFVGRGILALSCIILLLLALIIVCRIIQFWRGSLRDIE